MRIPMCYHNAEHVCSAPQTELSLTLLQSVESHFVRKERVAHHTFNYNMSRNYKLCMSFFCVCVLPHSPSATATSLRVICLSSFDVLIRQEVWETTCQQNWSGSIMAPVRLDEHGDCNATSGSVSTRERMKTFFFPL